MGEPRRRRRRRLQHFVERRAAVVGAPLVFCLLGDKLAELRKKGHPNGRHTVQGGGAFGLLVAFE